MFASMEARLVEGILGQYEEPKLPKPAETKSGEAKILPLDAFAPNLDNIKLDLTRSGLDPVHAELRSVLAQDTTCQFVMCLNQSTVELWELFRKYINSTTTPANSLTLLEPLGQGLRLGGLHRTSKQPVFRPEHEYDATNPVEAELLQIAERELAKPNTTVLRITPALANLISPLFGAALKTLPQPCSRGFPVVYRLENVCAVTALAVLEFCIGDTHGLLRAMVSDYNATELLALSRVAAEHCIMGLAIRLHAVAESAYEAEGSLPKILAARHLFKDPFLYPRAFQKSISTVLKQPLSKLTEFSNSVLEHIFASPGIMEPEFLLLNLVSQITFKKLIPEAKASQSSPEESKSELTDAQFALKQAWPLLRHIRLASIPAQGLKVMLAHHPLFPPEFANLIIECAEGATNLKQADLSNRIHAFFNQHPEYFDILSDLTNPGGYCCPPTTPTVTNQLKILHFDVPLKGFLSTFANALKMKTTPETTSSQADSNTSESKEASASSKQNLSFAQRLTYTQRLSHISNFKHVWPIFSVSRREGNALVPSSEIINTPTLLRQYRSVIDVLRKRLRKSDEGVVYGHCCAQNFMYPSSARKATGDKILKHVPPSGYTAWIMRLRGAIIVLCPLGAKSSSETIIAMLSDDPDRTPGISLIGSYSISKSGTGAIASFGSDHIRENFNEFSASSSYQDAASDLHKPLAMAHGNYQIIAWEIHGLAFPE